MKAIAEAVPGISSTTSVNKNTIVGLLPTRNIKENEVCNITGTATEMYVHADGLYLTELVFVRSNVPSSVATGCLIYFMLNYLTGHYVSG
jgi:hypothetical protein